MLRDLASGRDAQAEAALAVIVRLDADVILLGDVDWDAGGAGLAALRARLEAMGLGYPHVVSRAPNAGRPSGADLDGNGRLGEARDALGYGAFTGDSGIALLSRPPLGPIADHSDAAWDGGDLVPAGVTLPVATVAQWVVPLAGTDVVLVTLAAGTPVFDGPEDRNGRRNVAELALAHGLAREAAADGALPVLLGRGNVDPVRGQGDRAAMRSLLDDPGLRDPRPRGTGPRPLATAVWDGPGPLRVDYVLPDARLVVTGAGVVRPAPDDPFAATVAAAGAGRAVWVDLTLP